MTARLLLTTAALLLAPPAGAALAKGVIEPRVCGPSGCVPIQVDAESYALFDGGRKGPRDARPGTPGAGDPSRLAALARSAPSYRLRYAVLGDGRQIDTRFRVETTFVPAHALIRRPDGTWVRVRRAAVSAVRPQLAGVAPFPGRPRPAPAREAAAGDGWLGGWPAVGAALAAMTAAAIATGRRRREGARD